MRTLSLQKFCSTDESRGQLLKPWRDGDFTYASDGRIIVRVAAELEDVATAGAPTTDSLERLFAAFIPVELAWQKLPELPAFETKLCEFCHAGEHECECGQIHRCGNCEGTGRVPDDGHLDIGPARFNCNCYYLRLIAKLPNLEISIIADLEPMLFRFDCGVGVLMPMRKDQEFRTLKGKI